MSMKWVECLNYNLQHDISEKLTFSITATSPSIYQAWVASLWLPATIEVLKNL